MTHSDSLGSAFSCRRLLSPPLSKLLYGSLLLAPLAFVSPQPVAAQAGVSYGWVPLLRPETVNSPQGNTPEDYDWTGLDGDLYQTDGSYTQYKAYFADGDADSEELDLGANATVTGGSWLLTGTSTYKWLWTPPGTAQSVHNDPAKAANDPTQPFPTPPVFAFGLTIPFVEGYYDNTVTPITASGDVKDGFDPSWNPKFDLSTSASASAPANSLDKNNMFINELPRRSILAATIEGDNATANVTLTPSAGVQVTTGGGGSNGYGYGYLEEGSSLIALYYPNPFIRPDLGDFAGGLADGSNQFVYDAQMPGQLGVPAQIGVPDALVLDDLNWLISPPTGNGTSVDWRFGTQSAALANRLPYTITDQVIQNQNVLAPNTTITNSAGASIPGVNFSGLPSSNGGFGTYPVTMTVKTYNPASKETTTHDSQTAYIQTFFQGNASNFPGSQGLYTGDPNVQTAPPPYSPPNWYYYYPQVDDVASRYPVTMHYEAGKGVVGGASHISDDPANGYPVEIHNDAYGPRINVAVFDINPALEPRTGTHLARHIGDLTVKGLFEYVYTLGHETGHFLTYTTPDDTQPGSYIYNLAIPGLSPSWKQYHHLDKDSPDTTGVYGAYQGDVATGDTQLTADLNAVKELFAYTSSLQGALPQDWSDGSWNYSGGGLPYFAKELYNKDMTSLVSGKPPTFYLSFKPVAGVSTYGSGTPVLMNDGSYEIRSVADLQLLYPNVVIGLEGLYNEAPVSPGP